jgi:ribosomal protein S18 acetylase RimI-like enzyme
LGRSVTSAVIDSLRDIDTIGLNVRANNAAAIRLYESLGLARHCEFYEAVATKSL